MARGSASLNTYVIISLNNHMSRIGAALTKKKGMGEWL